MSTKALTIGIATVLAVGIAIITFTAGGEDGDPAESRETDGAFIVAMTSHHESAIKMAKVALQRTEHPQVKQLARAITAAQVEEINELASIHSQLFGLPTSKGDHGILGLEEDQMGMSANIPVLAESRPFDRTFIDMMVAHHQGAIRMARVELQGGASSRLMTIAQGVIEDQSREIQRMNSWRQKWYGSPSPAGGVPSEEKAMADQMTMGN